MAKKKLEDQIKIIGYWLFGGVFWYLVVSFFLLSNYPIQDYLFDHQKAYDVLKDAFTLAAAFLAPITAFVLFTDWRSQHKAIKNENLSVEILRILHKELLPFFNLKAKREKDAKSFNEHQMQYHMHIANIFLMVDEIESINDQSIFFKNCIKSLEKDFSGLYWSLYKQIDIVFQYNEIANFLDTSSMRRKNYLIEELDKYEKLNEIHYQNIMQGIGNLESLRV